MSNSLAPWFRFEDGQETGLAVNLFRCAMQERNLVEGCDYQLISDDLNRIEQPDGTPGADMLSGYVDAALGFAPSAARRNNFLFTLPFHDASSPCGSDFGVGILVNKKSPCAKKLIYAFNEGLRRIIANGKYANLVLQHCRDVEFAHWATIPTACTRPELFALIALQDRCRPHSATTAPCFNHTLLIAAGDQSTNAGYPWHNYQNGVDVGLSRRLFSAIMHCQGFKEGCDFQYVSPSYAPQIVNNNMAGDAITSGWVDAALTHQLTTALTNAFLFGCPINDNQSEHNYGMGLLINKKSPCAIALQRVWNMGLAKLICSGRYQELVDELGGNTFTAWTAVPNSDPRPELSDMLRLCVHRYCGEEVDAADAAAAAAAACCHRNIVDAAAEAAADDSCSDQE
jgi:hypothetical protein